MESSTKKTKVKVKLADKYVKNYTKADSTDALIVRQAYLAGFERAKALYMDAIVRFCDEHVPKDNGKKVSECVAGIGDNLI